MLVRGSVIHPVHAALFSCNGGNKRFRYMGCLINNECAYPNDAFQSVNNAYATYLSLAPSLSARSCALSVFSQGKMSLPKWPVTEVSR